MGVEVLTKVFVETKLSDEKVAEISKYLKENKDVIHQNWMTSYYFDSAMKSLSKAFSDLKFHCVYFTDGWQDSLVDELWSAGSELKTQTILSKEENKTLESFALVASHFDDQRIGTCHDNTDCQCSACVTFNTIETAHENLKTKYINKYASNIDLIEITHLFPKDEK